MKNWRKWLYALTFICAASNALDAAYAHNSQAVWGWLVASMFALGVCFQEIGI